MIMIVEISKELETRVKNIIKIERIIKINKGLRVKDNNKYF